MILLRIIPLDNQRSPPTWGRPEIISYIDAGRSGPAHFARSPSAVLARSLELGDGVLVVADTDENLAEFEPELKVSRVALDTLLRLVEKRSHDLGGYAVSFRPSMPVFAANSVTGVWNLKDGWKDTNGRGRRLVHGVLMLVADAGFVATGLLAPDEGDREHDGVQRFGGNSKATHRTVAITSMGIAAVSYLTMLLWRP